MVKIKLVVVLSLLAGHVFSQMWESIGLHTEAMKNAGIESGEGGQYHTGLDRSKSSPNVLYTCFDVGHIEKSSDGGATWQFLLQKGLKAGTLCSVAIHPQDTNVVYGYGNYVNYKTDSESGVYKTTDRGTTWSKVLSLTNTYYNAGDVSSGVGGHHQIEIDPANPEIIYFGSYKQGFYKSVNGGSTWTKTSNSTLDSKGIRVVRIDPHDHSKLLVGTDEGELWISTDSGITLSLVSNHGIPSGTIGNVVFHPSIKDVVFASSRNNGVYKSVTGGASPGSYSLMPKSNKKGVVHVDISPLANGASDYLFLMTTSVGGTETYYSHDGGQTWENGSVNISLTFHGSISTWIGGVTNMSCDPADKNTAIATIGTRVYKTTDGGATWEPSNVGHNGFAGGRGEVSFIHFDKQDPDKMWTFHYDFGTVVTTNNWDTAERLDGVRFPSPSWGSHQVGGTVLPSGRIFAVGGTYYNHVLCRKDPGGSWLALNSSYNWTSNSSSIDVGAADYCEALLAHSNGTTVYFKNLRSDDSGNTWTEMGDGTYHVLGMFQNNCDIIYAVRYISSSDRTRTQVIYKSTDKGQTWNPLPAAPVRIGYSWTSICLFKADPVKEDRFYTINPTDVSCIYKYDEGTWERITVVPDRETRSIAIDPNSPNVLYCSVSAKGEPFLYKSEDNGKTWTSIQDNYPMQGMAYLAVNPHDGSLYASSMLGLWKLPGTGTMNIKDVDPVRSGSINCYPNPFTEESTIKYRISVPGNVKLEIYSNTGQKIRTLVNEAKTLGEYSVSWNGKNEQGQVVLSGTYLEILKTEKFIQTAKILFVR
jgi:photosystem II stability/assembly factor-like uncharacterized protein